MIQVWEKKTNGIETGDSCVKELMDWCYKWGPFMKDAGIRGVEISASVDNHVTIKAEVFARSTPNVKESITP